MDGWVLHGAAIEALEKSFDGSGEEVELDVGAVGVGFEAEGVTLRAAPSAPFDDDGETDAQELAPEVPLQGLDFLALGFVIKIDVERSHPVVRAEANRGERLLESACVRGFAGAGETADQDEAWADDGGVHEGIISQVRDGVHGPRIGDP